MSDRVYGTDFALQKCAFLIGLFIEKLKLFANVKKQTFLAYEEGKFGRSFSLTVYDSCAGSRVSRPDSL